MKKGLFVMKKRKQHFLVVEANSAYDLQNRLNEWVFELEGKVGEVKIRRTQLSQSSYIDPHGLDPATRPGKVVTVYTALVNYEYEES